MKTYDELRADRQRAWHRAARMFAKGIEEDQARLAQMPDVLNAPKAGDAWRHEGARCRICDGDAFTIAAWVILNGRNHRAEVVCGACRTVHTWDWAEQAFIWWARA